MKINSYFKQKIIQSYIKSQEFDHDLVVIDSADTISTKGLKPPGVRRSLDYQGIARRALVVDPLPEGALPTYDRDIDVSAVIKDDASTKVFGQRVAMPTFEIFASPTIRIGEVKSRRFNMIDRGNQHADCYIWPQED